MIRMTLIEKGILAAIVGLVVLLIGLGVWRYLNPEPCSREGEVREERIWTCGAWINNANGMHCAFYHWQTIRDECRGGFWR